MDKRYLIEDYYELDSVDCPHCLSKNHKTHNRCSSCSKVMFLKKSPFWKIQVRPSVSFLVILCALLLAVYHLVAQWVDSTPKNITSHVIIATTQAAEDIEESPPLPSEAPESDQHSHEGQ